jgi:hypothetical protein
VTPVSITAADGSTVPVSNVTVDSATQITVTGVAPPASNPTETATVTVGTAPSTSKPPTPAQILGNQIQCDPSMDCTQPVISTTDGSDPPLQNVVVGQKIHLTTPALPATIKPTSMTWTVGGTRIAGYNPTTGPTDVTPIKAADLKQANVAFYWVYPNSASPVAIPVTYTYCANIPGLSVAQIASKLNCSLTANASFNLGGPGDEQMIVDAYDRLNVDMIIDKNACFPILDDKDPYLYYANASGSDDPCPVDVTGDPVGIKFTQPASSPPSPDGTYSFVQVVTGGRIDYVAGIGKGAKITIPGLDGQYPYPRNAPGDLFVSDSPDVALVDNTVYSKVSRTFSANMFIMWTSSKTGAIPVPIGSQNWHFNASTKNTGYPTSETWTTPATVYAGTDGDLVDYVQTAPSSSPYGYPTWKGLASKVWSTTNANEVDQEDGQ